MKVRVRIPDGGESLFEVDQNSRVDKLRQCVQWCIENKDWNSRVISEKNRRKKNSSPKPPDEMWTLNEQTTPESLNDGSDQWGETLDLETVMGSSCAVHDSERKTIELLFGTQLLEVASQSLTFPFALISNGLKCSLRPMIPSCVTLCASAGWLHAGELRHRRRQPDPPPLRLA